MKIGIAGTGAVGGYFGGLLALAGNSIVFLTRGKNYEFMKKHGLVIETNQEMKKVQGNFTNCIDEFEDVDLVVFAVKSNDTKEMATKLKPYLKEDARILTLQNGVDNEECLADILGRERILSAAAYIQAQMKNTGIIMQIGNPPFFLIGSYDNQKNKDFLDRLSDICNEAEIHVHLSNHIMEAKWKKLIWNVTFNPLSALIEDSIASILDDEGLLAAAKRICKESIQVARLAGVDIDDSYIESIISQGQLARDHQTSMLQDRLKGKPMELESIGGFILHKGKELGIETPTIDTIYHLLKYSEKEKISHIHGSHYVK